MSVFKNILGKNKRKFEDFSSLKVDFHSHLIPNIDDGSKSYDVSVDLIKRLHKLGFEKIITTPHIMTDFFRNTPQIVKDALEKLRHEVQQEDVPVTIEAAAEYLIDDGFEKKFRDNQLMTFGDNHLLIELSTLSPPYNFKELLFDLQIEGYKIILAHPERYTYWMHDFKMFEELKNRNVLFQLNTVSLTGFYPDPTKKFAQKLIDAGMIDFLGSDMHNHNYFKALQNSLGEKYLQKLLVSGKLKNEMFL